MESPAVEEVDGAEDDCALKRQPEEGVGDAAMVLEGGDGAAGRPEGVEVGGFGGEGHGEGRVGGLAVEAGAGEAGPGHEVGDGFHCVQHSAGLGRDCRWVRYSLEMTPLPVTEME